MNAPLTTPGPLYRWVGGKTLLLSALRRCLPDTFGRYFAPFVGGGALFWHLAERGAIDAVLADAAAPVTMALRGVRDAPDAVCLYLDGFGKRFEADHKGTFDELRDILHTPERRRTALVSAALLAHQQVGFNGLWRVNRKGRPNVALGKIDGRRHRVVVNEPLIRACSRALALSRIAHKASFRPSMFEPVWRLPTPEAGDLVYLDPPYVPASPTSSFTGYTAAGFGMPETRELAAWAEAQLARGVHVVISNSDTAGTAEAFGLDRADCPWRVQRVTRKGTVSSGKDRSGVGEVVLW